MITKLWYELDKKDLPGELFSLAKNISNDHQSHRESVLRNFRLYGGPNAIPTLYGGSKGSFDYYNDRSSWNLIRSVTDTLMSRMASNKPRPLFLPSGGDFSTKKKAKLLTKFSYGQFMSHDIYTIAKESLLDALVCGTGVLKVSPGDNCINVERVFPLEILVDELEGLHRKPQTVLQVKCISKDVLLNMFPEQADKINMASFSSTTNLFSADTNIGEFIDIIEAWHLPTSTSPGRRVLSLSNVVLEDTEYNEPDFPFVFFRYSNQALGFWGTGIAEQLTSIQYQVNVLLDKIEQIFHVLGVPWVLVERGADVPTSHINNEIGTIIRYNKTPPRVDVHNTVAPEIFNHLERLKRQAFEEVGVSQMSASSRKEPGITAGVAIREMNDIESSRFLEVSQRWENVFLSIARQLICSAKQLEEYDVPVRGNEFFEKINWKDIDLEEDMYQLDLYPTNLLPTKPEGRMQRVIEMMKAGLIDKEAGIALLDVPDLEAWEDLSVAGREAIEKGVENIIDNQQYFQLEPFDDTEYAMSYAIKSYHKCRNEDAPEEVLELLRQLIADVLDMKQEMAAPPEQLPLPGVQGPVPAPALPLPAGPPVVQ